MFEFLLIFYGRIYLAIVCTVIMGSIISYVLAFKLRTMRKIPPASVCMTSIQSSETTEITRAYDQDPSNAEANGRSVRKLNNFAS